MQRPAQILIGSVTALVMGAGALAGAGSAAPEADGARPPTVTILPGLFAYPNPGEFLRDGHPVAGPTTLVSFERPFEIMKYQVSVADYEGCVDAGACRQADAPRLRVPNNPITGVSYLDAIAYARWQSERTGQTWRLPTAMEWAFAAGERFVGDAADIENDPTNPARRWLSLYERESARGRTAAPDARVQGSFGTNTKGLADVGGNVWEWTATCYVRATLASDAPEVVSRVENCGVHVVEGRHRAYMSDFIRDGKSGGCAVGTPPDNLGFRLVREPRSRFGLAGLKRYLRGLATPATD
ncbi:MAG: SUMF1/EgtB/PvdO family nonheme iron enzyme [Mesorhizobium sp.]|nr:SUMF1/EgtB/PvdO family nonheme iron enzyme [Mesorhizobium sp.]